MAANQILKPYEQRRDPGPVQRTLLVTGLLLVAAFYGLMCTVLPMSFVLIPATPIVLMAGIAMWMLPEIGGVQIDRMQTLMLWYMGLNIVWPNYVAFDLPGLPLVTPIRLVLFSLVGIFIFNFATSAELRHRVVDALGALPVVRNLFWAFWVLTTISLVLSAQPFFSFQKYMNNQIYWTMLFCVSALLATRPGYVAKLGQVNVVALLIVVVAGLYEFRTQTVFWLDHLPPLMSIDQSILEKVGKSQARAGTDVYRVRGTFAVSLYFAEYLAMVFPLALHFVARERRFWPFVLLFSGLVATVIVMYLTNARSAMVGMLLGSALYLFFAASRRRRTNPSSIWSMTVLTGYPVLMGIVAMIVLFWNRAHVLVLGGGQHQASSEARSIQWAMGLPKVLTHPLGHGVARAGEVLGYANAGGEITIDTYYLSLLLDYGVLGLLLFIAMFVLPGWYGFRASNDAQTAEQELAAPLAIGLLNFIVVKSVLSSEGNSPLAFIMLGAIVGIVWQQKNSAAHAPAAMSIAPKSTGQKMQR